MGHEVVIDGALVHKRYESFARGEDEREFTALQLFQRYAPGLAPRPVRRESGALTMTRLDGRELAAADLSVPLLPRVVACLNRSHTAIPAADVQKLDWSLGAIEYMLPRVLRMRAELDGDLHPRIEGWLRSADCRSLQTSEVVFGRADHNLANFLIDDAGRIRLIDFEDSGKIDRAMDFAQLIEHISAIDVPQSVWDRIVELGNFCEPGHMLRCRRLTATFWLLLLHGTPRASLQERRVLRLLP